MRTIQKKNNSFNLSIVLKASFTIVGTLIGAGFASGKEITTFFGCYGTSGYLFIAIFCILFALGIIYFSGIDINTLPRPLKICMNSAVFVSEFISVTAMMAGLSSILSMLFSSKLPFFIFLVVIFIVITSGIKGLTTTNLILIPVLFISIIIFGVIGAKDSSSYALAIINDSPIFRVLSLPLYLGLNLFSIFPIATEFGKLQNKKERVFSSVISTLIIFMLMICFCTTILNIDSTSITSELPLVVYVIEKVPSLLIVVVLTLAMAITTTIISDGFVIRQILNSINPRKVNLMFTIIFICAFLISGFGFAEIVETLYPISGFVGCVLIISILYSNIKIKSYRPHIQLNIKKTSNQNP